MSKSASSADHLDKTGGFENCDKAPVALSKRSFSLERPLENKSASESNLLTATSTDNLANLGKLSDSLIFSSC